MTLLGDCEGTSDGLHNPLNKASFPGRKPGSEGLPGIDSHERFGDGKDHLPTSNPSFLFRLRAVFKPSEKFENPRMTLLL